MSLNLTTWEKFIKTLERGKTKDIKEFLSFLSPIELAEILQELPIAKLNKVISLLTEEEIAEAFEFMSEENQKLMALQLDIRRLSRVIDIMAPDEAADLLTVVNGERARESLKYLDKETSANLQKLMSHSPDSAGGLMTSDFISVNAEKTAGEALEDIRELEPDESEIISYAYVVDEEKRLSGVVSLRELFIAEHDSKINEIMHENVISVSLETDQEEVAAILDRYGLLAIPVTDQENRLQGIVTLDDIVEVIETETTEDIYKQSGLSVADAELLRSEKIIKAPILSILKLRIPWLVIVLIGGLLAGGIIGQFEEILESVVILAFFIPVIMDMGGNVGTQSSTIFIRGVVLGQIDVKKAWKYLGKETLVGLTIGALSGAAAGLVAYLWQGEPLVGVVVFLSMTLTCALASTIGYLFPLLSHRFGFDPAASANPLITTVKDVTGLLIYFTLASFFLKQLL